MALVCITSSTNLHAAPVEFTTDEGYVNNFLGGQPFLGPKWAVAGGSSSFYVDPSGTGKVVVNTAQAATQNAVWQTPSNLSQQPSATASVDFTFVQNPTATAATILGLSWFSNPTSGNSNVYAMIKREAGVDRYRVGFYQNSGSPAINVNELVSGTLLGLNSASADHTSDTLRLSYTLTRGANESSWQAVVTLTNLTTSQVVSTVTAPTFTTSTAFFSDTSLYPSISSQSIQSASLSSLDILAYRPPGGTVAPDLPGMTPTFSDEFEAGALDAAKWVPHYCKPATINGEFQVYLPDTFEFSGTSMRIRADVRSFGGKNYTSGAITSFGRFAQTYGYFEMRSKVPEGRGLWPAFWLLPQNQGWPPEVDIMENLGENPTTVHNTFHYNDPELITPNNPTGRTKNGKAFSGPDFSSGFHTYAVSWRPGILIYYVDGIERHRITDFVPAAPMYLLANMGVGGNWPVDPDFTTPFPAFYDIDYIRAYQYDDLPPAAPLAMTFGPTEVTPKTASPGDVITVNSSAVIGNADIAKVSIHMYIKDFWGTTVHGHEQQFLYTLAHNTARPFTFSSTLPSNLPPGLYNVAFTMIDAGKIADDASLGLVARFSIGSPLPPFPQPPVFPNVTPINLAALAFSDVAGQGTATQTLVNSGFGLRLQGNGWKSASLSYTVTPKTWLEFEISAQSPGEVYGIGLLPTATYDNPTLNSYSFQIFGNQTLGRQQYNTYSVISGGVKKYRIPVGGFFTGAITKLLFVNDMDASPTGDVTFSNIKIYEGP